MLFFTKQYRTTLLNAFNEFGVHVFKRGVLLSIVNNPVFHSVISTHLMINNQKTNTLKQQIY